MFIRTLLLISVGLLYLGPYRIVVGFPSTYTNVCNDQSCNINSNVNAYEFLTLIFDQMYIP